MKVEWVARPASEADDFDDDAQASPMRANPIVVVSKPPPRSVAADEPRDEVFRVNLSALDLDASPVRRPSAAVVPAVAPEPRSESEAAPRSEGDDDVVVRMAPRKRMFVIGGLVATVAVVGILMIVVVMKRSPNDTTAPLPTSARQAKSIPPSKPDPVKPTTIEPAQVVAPTPTELTPPPTELTPPPAELTPPPTEPITPTERVTPPATPKIAATIPKPTPTIAAPVAKPVVKPVAKPAVTKPVTPVATTKPVVKPTTVAKPAPVKPKQPKPPKPADDLDSPFPN